MKDTPTSAKATPVKATKATKQRGAPKVAAIFLWTGLLCIGAFLVGLIYTLIEGGDVYARFAFDGQAEHLPFWAGFVILLSAGPVRQLASVVQGAKARDTKTMMLAGFGFTLLLSVYALAFLTDWL